MTKLFSANRVALILHSAFIVLTAASVFVAAVNHSLPKSWQANAAAAVVLLGGLAAATVAVTKFLDGSQKSEALQARVAPYIGISTGSSTAGGFTLTPTQASGQPETADLSPAELEQGPPPEPLDDAQWLANRAPETPSAPTPAPAPDPAAPAVPPPAA